MIFYRLNSARAGREYSCSQDSRQNSEVSQGLDLLKKIYTQHHSTATVTWNTSWKIMFPTTLGGSKMLEFIYSTRNSQKLWLSAVPTRVANKHRWQGMDRKIIIITCMKTFAPVCWNSWTWNAWEACEAWFICIPVCCSRLILNVWYSLYASLRRHQQQANSRFFSIIETVQGSPPQLQSVLEWNIVMPCWFVHH